MLGFRDWCVAGRRSSASAIIRGTRRSQRGCHFLVFPPFGFLPRLGLALRVRPRASLAPFPVRGWLRGRDFFLDRPRLAKITRPPLGAPPSRSIESMIGPCCSWAWALSFRAWCGLLARQVSRRQPGLRTGLLQLAERPGRWRAARPLGPRSPLSSWPGSPGSRAIGRRGALLRRISLARRSLQACRNTVAPSPLECAR